MAQWLGKMIKGCAAAAGEGEERKKFLPLLLMSLSPLKKIFQSKEEEKSTKKQIVLHFGKKAHCLKITQNVSFEFSILAFSTIFCPSKIGLSGNTV